MKRLLIALLAAAPLAGCAGYYGGGVGGYYGPPAGYYDGFYDDFYGPIYDGYWGPNDVFFYRSTPTGHFHADRDRHFRHDMHDAPGGGHFHSMHGEFHGGGEHHGGGHHGGDHDGDHGRH